MTRFSFVSGVAPLLPALALVLPGCAAVPNLPPAPTIAPPASYASGRSLSGIQDEAWPAAEWWKAYNDPELDGLIAEALAGSPDLATAAARVRRADAYVQENGAKRLPTLDVSGSAAVAKQSYNNGIPADFVPQGWNSTGRVEANLGFDLDLWGRNKASFAAARSDVEAARLDLAQAVLTLSTNVADAYADLGRHFAELAVRKDGLDVRERTAALTTERVNQGLDTQAELKLTRSAASAARADLGAVEERIALTRNRIAALLGQGPDRGLLISAPRGAINPNGLPSDVTTNLIGHRPDIIAARVRVEAEASRIKVARAGFYPSVNLSAAVGFQSLGLSNLFMGGSSFGNAGPAVTLPLFRGGELQGRYRGARASYDEAVASYDRTVTDAYRAVADAVASRSALGSRLNDSRASLADARAAYAVAKQRYEGGLSNFLEVLTAEDRALQSQLIVSDLEARVFSLDVALVRALGGGFSTSATSAPNTSNKEKTNG